jgi:ankyrin repeat protein
LNVAVKRDFLEAVSLLIKVLKADVNKQDGLGNTALIVACACSNYAMVKKLIQKYYADWNLRNISDIGGKMMTYISQNMLCRRHPKKKHSNSTPSLSV